MQTTQESRRYHSRRSLTVDLTTNADLFNGKRASYISSE